MANPIQRLVKFVFDRSAANKAEGDAKKSLGRVEKGFARLKKTALALGGVLAATFGIRAIARFGRESIRVATEATQIWGRLEKAVENTGISYANVQDEINATARAMQDATVVGDEDFAAILAELITTSNDYEASLRNVSVVADLAAAKNLEFRSAAQLVGRAMVGQTSTLTRYGIVIKEGEDAMEVLRRQFAGFSANEATTFAGQVKQLNNEWGDFKQAVGDAMIEAGNGASVLATLTATLKVSTQWINDNRSSIAAWGQVLVQTLKAGGETFRFLVRITKNAFESVAGALALLANDLTQTWARTINVIVDGLNKIPGVNIDFRMNQLSPEGFAEQQRLLTEQIAENAGNMKDALLDLADSYSEVGRAAAEAARAQGAVTPTTQRDDTLVIPDVTFRVAPDMDYLESSAGRVIKVFEDLGLSIPNQVMADMNRQMEMARNLASLTGQEYFTLQTEMDMLTGAMQTLLENGMDPTDRRLQALAGRLRQVQEEQAMVTKQHEIMAGVAESTGEILNAAFGAGIGVLAAGKAKQNAIMAAEQLAMGLVASLNPFTAPKAAGHYAAAGQFAGIATAWGALAGATGGFSAGGSGGISSGRRPPGGTSERLAQPAPEVSVYLTGEGFDAINPRVQRVVYGALQEAQNSVGPNARVRVFRQNQVIQES